MPSPPPAGLPQWRRQQLGYSYAARAVAGGRRFTLAVGTFSIRAVQEGKRALQLSSSSAQSRRRSTFMEKCPRGCCRPCGRNGSPGLALSLCWVRLRTVRLEGGPGTPSPGLEAGPESQDGGLYRHCQGELLLTILCSDPDPLLGGAEGTNFELLNSSCLSSDVAPTGPRR